MIKKLFALMVTMVLCLSACGAAEDTSVTEKISVAKLNSITQITGSYDNVDISEMKYIPAEAKKLHELSIEYDMGDKKAVVDRFLKSIRSYYNDQSIKENDMEVYYNVERNDEIIPKSVSPSEYDRNDLWGVWLQYSRSGDGADYYGRFMISDMVDIEKKAGVRKIDSICCRPEDLEELKEETISSTNYDKHDFELLDGEKIKLQDASDTVEEMVKKNDTYINTNGLTCKTVCADTYKVNDKYMLLFSLQPLYDGIGFDITGSDMESDDETREFAGDPMQVIMSEKKRFPYICSFSMTANKIKETAEYDEILTPETALKKMSEAVNYKFKANKMELVYLSELTDRTAENRDGSAAYKGVKCQPCWQVTVT